MSQNPQNLKRVDIEYYEWLISQIKTGSKREFRGLFEILHNTEFTWFIPNDDNRMADGFNLRNDFFRGIYGRKYRKGLLVIEGVSMLEVIVALSRRVGFQMTEDPHLWAWRLIKNIGLNKMSDPLTEAKVEKIKTILDDLIWRNYERNGQGGFFPLRQTVKDQTKIEIWYQMHEYLMELDGLG
jgi:hypothetical protein